MQDVQLSGLLHHKSSYEEQLYSQKNFYMNRCSPVKNTEKSSLCLHQHWQVNDTWKGVACYLAILHFVLDVALLQAQLKMGKVNVWALDNWTVAAAVVKINQKLSSQE